MKSYKKHILYILTLIPCVHSYGQSCDEIISPITQNTDIKAECVSLMPGFSTNGYSFSAMIGFSESIEIKPYVNPTLSNLNFVHEKVYTYKTTEQQGPVNMGDIVHTVNYFDGLGRTLQTVQVNASPTGNDIIQPHKYDEFGRESTQYLPYSTYNTNYPTNPGAFRKGAYDTYGSNQS